jgi:hypothetical protein
MHGEEVTSRCAADLGPPRFRKPNIAHCSSRRAFGLGVPLALEPSGPPVTGPFSVERWVVVDRRWIVVDTKTGQQVGKFATRYGAMVFAEHFKRPPGRYTVIDQIAPAEPGGSSGENSPTIGALSAGAAFLLYSGECQTRSPPNRRGCGRVVRLAKCGRVLPSTSRVEVRAAKCSFRPWHHHAVTTRSKRRVDLCSSDDPVNF